MEKKNSKKPLQALSFFDDIHHPERLWAKPGDVEANNLKKISPILAKNTFYKKGRRFGLWSSRVYFLTNDFLYYFKVSLNIFSVFNLLFERMKNQQLLRNSCI